MVKKLLLLFSLILSTYFSGICQNNPDIVNLMNGQTFEGTITDTTNGKILMNSVRKSKTKSYSFEHYRVFSIVKKDEPEIILYKRDTTIGAFLTQQEMKYFFLGEKDARKNYNPLGLKITACLVTYGISLMDTYRRDSTSTSFSKGFFKSEPGLASIVAPFAFTALAAFPSVQINISKVSDKNLLNQQPYIDGFEKVARSKKVFGALQFSLIGSALGILSYFIFK